MYKLYIDGSAIHQIKGQVDGGHTVLVDSSEDLDALEAVCVECEDMNSIGERISQYDSWMKRFVADQDRYRDKTEKALAAIDNKHPDDLSDVERFMLAIALTKEIWVNTPAADANGIQAMACVSARGGELIYKANEPALYFHEGTLLPAITPYVPRLGLFAICVGMYGVAIVRKTGILPSIQADKLVEELRNNAKRQAQFVDLPRLEELDPQKVVGKKAVIILLHGLFSTDIGTFDGFIRAWKEPPTLDPFETERLRRLWKNHFPDKDRGVGPSATDFQNAFHQALDEDYLIVGWPHDTLTKIKANAEKLFEDIYSKIGSNGPPIVFVCHSRGGLVARKTAVIMQEQDGVWADKVRLCVTFGTPHRGAALAESPFQYVAAFAAYMNGTGHVLSACSVLDYYRQTRAFEGIDDLRPPNAKGGEFLLELIEEERLRGKPKLRALNVLPVGSIYAGPNRRWARFMTGVLGTSEHDLVVPKKSSLPEGGFPHGELTDCGHGNYFDVKEVKKQYFKGILAKMREELQVEDAMLQRVIVSTPPSANLDIVLERLGLIKRNED